MIHPTSPTFSRQLCGQTKIRLIMNILSIIWSNVPTLFRAQTSKKNTSLSLTMKYTANK